MLLLRHRICATTERSHSHCGCRGLWLRVSLNARIALDRAVCFGQRHILLPDQRVWTPPNRGLSPNPLIRSRKRRSSRPFIPLGARDSLVQASKHIDQWSSFVVEGPTGDWLVAVNGW